MKKTLTVNLNGTVFSIDEDAYQLLDRYLDNLRSHFKKEEGSDEIMNDFESRISELLSEKIRLGYNVITIQQVEEVIQRMGNPEEIFEEETTEQTENGKKTTKESETVFINSAPKRKLYRNPDDKILGGVASGIAAYCNWDPTLVRIILIALLFLIGPVLIPIYLILWMIVPLARTASEKLEMRGESITLENIGKTVTGGFEKVSSNVNEYISSDKPRSALRKLGDVIVQIAGTILKLLGILVAVLVTPVLLFVLFILLIVVFALVVGGSGYMVSMLPFTNWPLINTYPEYAIILGSLGAILAIGIPVGVILYSIIGQLFHWKPVHQSVKWIFLILWIVGLVMCVIFGTHYHAGVPFMHSFGFPVHWNF